MLSSKDLESYIKVKEFMEKNNIKYKDQIAGPLMVVTDEDGDERKFNSLSAATKFIGVSMATMYYVHNNHRTKISTRVCGQKKPLKSSG